MIYPFIYYQVLVVEVKGRPIGELLRGSHDTFAHPAPSKHDLIRQEASFQILGLVSDEPNISIAGFSKRLGVSNGIAHYVMRNLIDRGHIGIKNFSANPNKRNCFYIPTPSCLSEKLKLVALFLKRKRDECYILKEEIRALQRSVELGTNGAESAMLFLLPLDIEALCRSP